LILIPVVAVAAAIVLLTYFQVKTSFSSTVEEMALEVSTKASDIVDEWLNGIVKEVNGLPVRMQL
jgi:methyl-accepting chemotaxis protein